MKRNKFLIFMFLVSGLILAGCETVQYNAQYGNSLNNLPEPQVDKGIICTIRPSSFVGAACSWNLFMDGQLVGRLLSGSYIYQTVDPGKHTVNITGGGLIGFPIEVNTKAGETIYLKTRGAMGFWEGQVFIEACPLEKAREYIRKYPSVNIH